MLESENIEYKAKIPDNPDNLKGEIVSFLNSISGGKIYIGLDDDGKPVDFENEEIKLETFKEWEQRISNWITDAFEPQVRDLMNVSIENKATVIDIRSGNDKPYRYKSRKAGPFDNIYIRSGSTKRKASKDEITRMLKRKNADTFDRGKVAYENLSFHYAKNTFEKLERDFDEISLGFKRNDKDSYNYAALILSDDNPNIAKFAVYNGLDVLEFKDKKNLKDQ